MGGATDLLRRARAWVRARWARLRRTEPVYDTLRDMIPHLHILRLRYPTDAMARHLPAYAVGHDPTAGASGADASSAFSGDYDDVGLEEDARHMTELKPSYVLAILVDTVQDQLAMQHTIHRRIEELETKHAAVEQRLNAKPPLFPNPMNPLTPRTNVDDTRPSPSVAPLLAAGYARMDS